MKLHRLFAFVLLASATLQAAPKEEKLAEIPKEKAGRWGVYSFEDAQKEAQKKKQPIVFIITDETVKDTSIVEAAKRVFWGLEKHSTMVMLPSTTSGTWTTRLPAAAAAALASKDLGSEFPKVVVVDQKGTSILGTMTGAQSIDSDEKTLKEFSRRMDESNKNPPAPGAAPAAAPAPAAPAAAVAATPAAPATTTATAPATPSPAAAAPAAAATPAATPAVVTIKDAKPDSWTNKEGRTIQATLVEAAADKIVFLMPNGSKIDYPVANLNDESRKKLEALKAASSR